MYIFKPAFVNFDRGNHGDVLGNIVMQVGDECDCRTHEFGIVYAVAEYGGVFGFDATEGISEAEAYLEKIRIE